MLRRERLRSHRHNWYADISRVGNLKCLLRLATHPHLKKRARRCRVLLSVIFKDDFVGVEDHGRRLPFVEPDIFQNRTGRDKYRLIRWSTHQTYWVRYTIISGVGKLQECGYNCIGLSTSKCESRLGAFKITGLTWIVERSFAWLGRNRRLSKDYEYRVQTSELMIDLAAMRLMLNR